jgi:hypothetical protein
VRLLVECGGTAALTYFLRCIPPPADISKLTALDEILDESVELIVGAVSPAALTQARAPTRFGGIGLRRITPLSPIAHFASLAQCIQSLPLCAHLPRDLCLFPLIAHPSLFPFPQVTSLMSSVLGDGPYPKKIQKSLSLALDTAAFVLLHSSLPADEKARLISLTQHGSSLWLHLPKAALEDNVWMSPSTAHTALRLRRRASSLVEKDCHQKGPHHSRRRRRVEGFIGKHYRAPPAPPLCSRTVRGRDGVVRCG